jgi:hypothetical protein
MPHNKWLQDARNSSRVLCRHNLRAPLNHALDNMTRRVPFLTIEDGDDLIVSFALGDKAETSLTLLRTLKYEPLLAEEERGVTVSSDTTAVVAPNLLRAVRWESSVVLVESTEAEYALDVSAVDPEEIREAKRVLKKMHFDSRFELSVV